MTVIRGSRSTFPTSRFPGEGRDPRQKWAPAFFAGVTNQVAVG
jgi:hypothetical protein